LFLAQEQLADVMLIDILEGVPQGKTLDIMQAASPLGLDAALTGSNDMADVVGSDMVIITAGLPRKPGMDRLDLLRKNAEIVGGIAESVAMHAAEAIVLVVSNPIDVMVYLTLKRTGFPTPRVLGQAGVLDSARMATFVAMELGVSVKEVSAMVLGGHGDTMVPLPRYTTVAGVPITELLSPERIAAINDRTQKGGGEIVNLLKTGSAFYAPAAASVKMAAAILRDSKVVLPASAYLTGQYGLEDIYVGVPVRLGGGGVEEVLTLELTETEQESLHASAAVYRASIKELNL
jgi:malate dehydrogenase